MLYLSDYNDIQDALDSDCPIVVAIAKIIDDLDGSIDPTDQKKVYNTIFNYLNNRIFLLEYI